ncbi:MAG: insulinase family protein, partial [Clostridiales bacterium]|nr:insulinase family protein [Clostridiales bacterium]
MFKIVTLKNGLRLALEEMDNTRAISFGIWTRNGSRDESLETSGISHFIEHMLFKGTIRRSSKQIADDIDAVSGHLNAYTTKDYTCYHVRTLDIHFDQALDVLSDMFLNSKFDDEELSKERGVILEEIDMYEDSPDELSHDLLQRGMFGDHSLGLPILGTKQSISKFGHETLKNYFVNNYAPSRIVLSMTGRFKTDEAVAKLEKIFGGLKDPENPAKLAPPPAIHPCVITRS